MPLVTYQGRELEYEIHGEGSAVPLLLATGTGGSFKGWPPLQAPEFAKRGRVVLFNHRGVGQSGDDGKSFSTTDLADEIPNARLVTVRYAAHLVMVESAERFNGAVVDFLDEA